MSELWLIFVLLAFALCGVIAFLIERIQRRELREFLRRERARHVWSGRISADQKHWRES